MHRAVSTTEEKWCNAAGMLGSRRTVLSVPLSPGGRSPEPSRAIGVPLSRLAGIALLAGTMAAVVSFAARPSDPAMERAETTPAPLHEVTPPAADPAPRPASAHVGRTFDVTKFRRGNVHTHTNRSDGDSDPSDVYNWYRGHGYHFVAITDHNTFINPDDFKFVESAAFAILGREEATMACSGSQV